MSFKVFTHILRNVLIKRNKDVILPNYANQLFVCFSLKKKNNILVVYIVLIEGYN